MIHLIFYRALLYWAWLQPLTYDLFQLLVSFVQREPLVDPTLDRQFNKNDLCQLETSDAPAWITCYGLALYPMMHAI